MDVEGDVKKMTDFINSQKSFQNNFQLEFQDFVNFKQCYNSDQEFDDEDEPVSFKHYKMEGSYTYIPTVTLTEEEKDVIDSCTDPDLKKLLILNRSKNLQLINLHKKMQDLLVQCEEELEAKNMFLKNSELKQVSQQTFIWKLAAPFFKDKKCFPSPLNEDAATKRAQNELSIYDLTPSPKWIPLEFDRLLNAVKCNYNINRQTFLVSKIGALKCKLQEEPEDKSKLAELVHLNEQLEEIKNDDKIPPLNSNENINWYKVSETFLRDKHTPLECQSVWHMLCHPQINKSEWSDEENKKLETIAKRYSYQNWDKIAAELKTNRTGFTTCLHYCSKLCDKFKKSKFTPEEDSFLLEVVDGYKKGNFIPWNKVVCHFNNRSRHQLYHRYTYFLSQNNIKRGKFSEAEDILLLILVNKFGRNFRKCAEYMPNRSQVQLKSRYNSNLQRHIKKGSFTIEEDEIICEYIQKYGEKNWSGLAERLKRCNAQVRQRYKLIKSFLHDNPNSTLCSIPNRKHGIRVSEDHYSFLKYIADQYKDVDEVPTLAMIEECLQTEARTSSSSMTPSETKNVKSIDALLTNFFSSSLANGHKRVITETSINEATENAEEVLTTLGVNLNIPKNLQCSVHLDNIDLEILEKLSKKIDLNETNVDKLISPNLSTLVGLRNLIIKHKDHKQEQKNKGNVCFSKNDKLLECASSTKTEILAHQDLFSRRFDKLFEWSAVLSLEKPNQFNISNDAKNTNKTPATLLKNSYTKRPMTDSDIVAVKKRKINVSDLDNLRRFKNSQLKLVDKSVVEKLIKQKVNLNIIKIDKITDLDGTVKPILRPNNEVSTVTDSNRIDENDPVCNLTSDASTMEDVVDDGDAEDVEKLNVMLKSVKSELSGDPSNDEYQAIKSDVQLLKEILKYEKVNVNSDPDGSVL